MLNKPNSLLEMFEDPEHAARYSDGPVKFIPGFRDIHRMATVLIREQTPENAKILVHGAGGGLELEAFALDNPNWTFVGVDPAKAMLDIAAKRLGKCMERTELKHGFIDAVTETGFDAATSLLTLHFLAVEERKRTVAEIVKRLRPGAPLIAVHSSFPEDAAERDLWLSRYEAFAIASGVEPEMALNARQAVSTNLPHLAPEQNANLLREAGLINVASFYSAFSWHGWIGYVA